ncbi:ABC transporter permease [Gluconacetobacter aggeris]|uniref:ABC transporter permease n=1 Tax=Gluconacetobacter aggeris TaxID=1286186 RepID=A0A7W4IS40_9PROT|nr:ABC transporter permease [Gluconacetobacter aggeris]MBB2168055.1 ABC transporter permease [Gluconacetobacter aggeris]
MDNLPAVGGRAVFPQREWAERVGHLVARARSLTHRPGFALATVFLAFVLAAAAAPTLLTHYQPYATSPTERLVVPGATHLFGTDALGRDLYARVIHGASLSVEAALIAIGIALSGGLVLGLFAGFAGGWVDAVIMRCVDVVLALPVLLLSLAVVTAIGFGTLPVAIAVGIGIVPGFARTTRAEVLRVRTLPYVESARLGGASRTYTLMRHVLPNCRGPVAALAILDFGSAILSVASLSFLGFGASPPASDWGDLIADGRDFLITAPWVSL